MMGQIFRIRGDMESSLDAFEKLLKTIESSDVGHKQKICEQLAISALIGRAEIYSSMKRTKEAVSTYQKLISKIENSSVTNDYVGYIPVAKDKMLNLLLKDGNIADYVKLVDEMLVDHGDYNRISIIEFKKTCIEFLCSVKANESFSGGSFQAPVELVRYLRRHGVRDNAIISEMQILCEKYEKDEGSILLYYHYAWALDAIGKREQAVEVLFEKVCSNVLGEAKERKAKSLSEELLRYATIQCVIMMGEQKAYEEAHLLVGDLLNDDEDQSHISKLAHSVAEGINVLEDKVEGNAIKK
jgi:tetratricopeptide (TPR) repeat protein